MNWSFVFICLGFLTTFSSIWSFLRLTTGCDHLNFTQIVSQHGYITEDHLVQTEDGYILNLYRITRSAKCERDTTKSPVLLTNGIMTSADCFLIAGVENALPCLIADACYDVWVGNARGSSDGRKHITLDPDRDKSFWDFSLDEIGKYDLPATVDYVLNITGKQQLNYIGYSQGSGSFFVMCSEKPDYSDKVKLLIGLAPSTKHTHTKSVLFSILRTLITTQLWDPTTIYRLVGCWEFMWKGFLEPIRMLCQYLPELCYWLMAMVDAPHPGSISTETLKRALEHFPAGTSTKNLARYGQSLTVDRFCKFDYGPSKNMELYGGNPPEFNLSAVTTPTYILHGKNDGIVDSQDLDWLVSQLPNVKELKIMEDHLWNHLDMMVNRNVSSVLFPKVLNYLKLFNDNEKKHS